MTKTIRVSTTVIKIGFVLFLFVLGFLFTKKDMIFGYTCPAGYSCSAEGSITQDIYRPGCELFVNQQETDDCLIYGCILSTDSVTYYCSGTDNNCIGQSSAYYFDYNNCINRVDPKYSYCCNGGSGGGGGGSCGCGTQECESTYNCNCTTWGCKIGNPTNSDEAANLENCIKYRCGNSNPVCVDCTLGDCPAPLTNSGLDDYVLTNYRSCPKFGSCAGTKYGSCYENPNAIPTSTINVNPVADESTSLGCRSSSYTGTEINNPINMRVVSTDANGASDIEAISVWLKTQTSIPNTPKYINGTASPSTAKTFTNNSYGFMMHKEGSNWVPYIVNKDTEWVKASYSNNRFAIKGPSSNDMVFVKINSITPSGNDITVSFDLDFNGIEDINKIADGTYNIFTMVNDVFGFTPYDNYGPEVTKIGDYFNPGQIRFYNSWINSGKNWSFDFTAPTFNSQISEATGYPTNITFSWDVADLVELYGVVGNVYVSDGVDDAEVKEIKAFNSIGDKTMASAPFTPQVQPEDQNNIGRLDSGYTVKAINMRNQMASGSVLMDVGSSREGSLIFYATAFDTACNASQSNKGFDLEDWIITYGGLVYSSGGVDFSVKDITDPLLWKPVALLNKISPSYADISSEMYGDASGHPSSLKKSQETKSFNISPFKEYKVTDYYNDVRNTFERREIGIPNITKMGNTVSLEGNLGIPDSSIKVLDRIGNLTVGTPSNAFTCNGKGIIFVSGNLTIENNILNSNRNSDACIFVVKGNVIINQGSNSSGGSIGYDEINAYILANGTVAITGDSSLDGLYISGGIQSLGGINTIGRYLGLSYRDTHPVLFINHHSKYGIFSSELIGSPVDMVKTEVGFKPY